MNTKSKAQTVLEAERMASFVRFRHLYLWMREGLKTAGKNIVGLAEQFPDSETPHSAFGDVLGDHLTTRAPTAASLRDLIGFMRTSGDEIYDAIEEVAKAADAWQTADAEWRLSNGGGTG